MQNRHSGSKLGLVRLGWIEGRN